MIFAGVAVVFHEDQVLRHAELLQVVLDTCAQVKGSARHEIVALYTLARSRRTDSRLRIKASHVRARDRETQADKRFEHVVDNAQSHYTKHHAPIIAFNKLSDPSLRLNRSPPK